MPIPTLQIRHLRPRTEDEMDATIVLGQIQFSMSGRLRLCRRIVKGSRMVLLAKKISTTKIITGSVRRKMKCWTRKRPVLVLLVAFLLFLLAPVLLALLSVDLKVRAKLLLVNPLLANLVLKGREEEKVGGIPRLSDLLELLPPMAERRW